MQGYIQLFFLWLLFTVNIRAMLSKKQNNGQSSSTPPPSPPALPIIGHLHLISKLPHRSLHNLTTRYGSIIQLFFGTFPNFFIVSSPELKSPRSSSKPKNPSSLTAPETSQAQRAFFSHLRRVLEVHEEALHV